MSVLRIVTELLTSNFDKGLQRMRTGVNDFRKDINSQFGRMLTFGAVAAGVRNILNEAERASDVAAKFGVLPSEIQKLENVASVTGGSMSALNGTMNAMWRRAQEAADGNETYRKSFDRLGISVDELRGKNAVEIFNMISNGVKDTTDKSVAFAAAFNVGGEQARELFTMLGMGADEIDRLGESMGYMSDRTTQQLAKVNTDFRAGMKFIKSIGGEVLGFLVNLYQSFMATIASMIPTIVTVAKEISKPWQAFGEMIGGAISALNGLSSALANLFKGRFRDAYDDAKMAGKHLVDGLRDGVETAASIDLSKIKDQFKEDTDTLAKVLADQWKDIEDADVRKPPTFPAIGQDGSGDDLSRERERVAQLEFEQRLRQLDIEQQIAELKKLQAEYQSQANSETREGLRAREQELRLGQRIEGLEERLEREKDRPKKPAITESGLSSDFLARVGGGMKGLLSPERATLDVAKDQLGVQKEMLTELKNPRREDLKMKA